MPLLFYHLFVFKLLEMMLLLHLDLFPPLAFLLILDHWRLKMRDA